MKKNKLFLFIFLFGINTLISQNFAINPLAKDENKIDFNKQIEDLIQKNQHNNEKNSKPLYFTLINGEIKKQVTNQEVSPLDRVTSLLMAFSSSFLGTSLALNCIKESKKSPRTDSFYWLWGGMIKNIYGSSCSQTLLFCVGSAYMFYKIINLEIIAKKIIAEEITESEVTNEAANLLGISLAVLSSKQALQ